MTRLLAAFVLLGSAAPVEDSPQTTTVRAMQKVLKEKNWALFYESHSAPA